MNWIIELAGALWRRMPKQVRRWGVLLKESRFTVAAGALVMNERGCVLLLCHRFRPGVQKGGGWGIPGGFLKPGEDPEAAVRRELHEEIGLNIANLELAFVRALRRYNQVEIIFRCQPQGEFRPQNHEISRAEWFAPDALPKDLSDDQRALIIKAISINTATKHLTPGT